MHATCTRSTFNSMPDTIREKFAHLLVQLHRAGLTCRVERVGNGNGEVYITVGPGMPSASYWLDRFDIEY